MRTNIDIDDELIVEAMRRTGANTKRAVVELALQTLIRLKNQEQVRPLRGQLHWEGDLDQARLGRHGDADC